jgi:DNA primase
VISFNSSEVAAYYAERAPGIKQRGRRWRGPCPIHGGRDANFSVDCETGLWKCFSQCGRGGDMVALEMVLTSATWRDAVTEIERIIGRSLLRGPANLSQRRAGARKRSRDQRDRDDAEVWRLASEYMFELVLEELPEAVPERHYPTQQLLTLRAAHGPDLLRLYRDYKDREPRLTAALVYAGERADGRRRERLARFVAALAEKTDAA